MVLLRKCPECSGEGTYKIYNVYDPTHEEEVTCEYCDGECFIPETPLFSGSLLDDLDDAWIN